MNPEDRKEPELSPWLIMFGLLYYYARKFDPDEVNEKSEKRSDVFTILKERRMNSI